MNGQKVAAEELEQELGALNALPGGYVLLRRGRKNAAMVHLKR